MKQIFFIALVLIGNTVCAQLKYEVRDSVNVFTGQFEEGMYCNWSEVPDGYFESQDEKTRKVRVKGQINDGQLVGRFTHFDEDGGIRQTGDYLPLDSMVLDTIWCESRDGF